MSEKSKEYFSIRQMIDLTGISEFKLRTWENRYSLFSPKRNLSGRRLYTKQDVEKALAIKELLRRDHKIGKIAQFSLTKLSSMILGHESINLEKLMSKEIKKSIELISSQNWGLLHDYFIGLKVKNVPNFINEFLLPLIVEMNALISKNLMTISQEHIVSSLIKEKIYSVLTECIKNKNQRKKRIKFVLATPEGDFHEIGLLCAHLLITSSGITSLYLGPNTPSSDLKETTLRFSATHLLVVATVSKDAGAKNEFLTYINQLQQSLGTKVKIVVAGSRAMSHRGAIENVEMLSDFYQLENMIKNIK